MSHHNTVFSQFLKLVPRREFERLANACHSGRSLRAISRWDQFVALMMGQLAGRQSLRDIVANLGAQAQRLYHLGCRTIARSTLARVNQNRSYKLYESLFGLLYQRCSQQVRSGHGFRFKNKLFSLDASLIDLSLAIFPWADYNRKKSALKLHLGLDHDGYIPSFATITSAKCNDLTVARTLKFKPGSIVVIDKGYIDYEWWKSLDTQGVYFVCRPRKNTCYRVTGRRRVRRNTGLTCDQDIKLTGKKPAQIRMRFEGIESLSPR